jgi:hypothetical protein
MDAPIPSTVWFPGLTDDQLSDDPVPVTTNAQFVSDQCSHTYEYLDGLLISDTASDGVSSWKKTYTYFQGNLISESKWVQQ